MRSRKCKACGHPFEPTMPLQSACSLECAILVGRRTHAAKVKKSDQEARQRLKTLSQRAADVQKVFNAAVRARDAEMPCISCGRPASWDGQWHASHMKSVGANSALRFNFWNVAKSCSVCNNYLSGNIDGYRVGILERHGQERLDWLDAAPRSRKYSVEYLERLECVLKKLLKRWKCRAESNVA